MTTEQKISDLKAVRDIISTDYHIGICDALRRLNLPYIQNYPELIKRSPIGANMGYWYELDSNGQSKRLAIINETITELEFMLNSVEIESVKLAKDYQSSEIFLPAGTVGHYDKIKCSWNFEDILYIYEHVIIKNRFNLFDIQFKINEWENLKYVSGYYISSNSLIQACIENPTSKNNKNVFVTENQARGVLAIAQLSQIMIKANDGWKPNWKDQEMKFVIRFNGEYGIKFGTSYSVGAFLAFKNAKIRETFASINKELINEYFLIYKY